MFKFSAFLVLSIIMTLMIASVTAAPLPRIGDSAYDKAVICTAEKNCPDRLVPKLKPGQTFRDVFNEAAKKPNKGSLF